MEQKAINCIKVVLSGNKEVLLREMKLKYQNLALQAIGAKGKDNQLLAGAMMVQELIKILIIKVDGQEIKKQQLESLDEIFSFKQIQQLQTVVGKMMGGDDEEGELTTEFVSIGGQ
jgi:hypothetical protein